MNYESFFNGFTDANTNAKRIQNGNMSKYIKKKQKHKAKKKSHA